MPVTERPKLDLDKLSPIDYRRADEQGRVCVALIGEHKGAGRRSYYEVLVLLDGYQHKEDREELGAVSPGVRIFYDEIGQAYTHPSELVLARFTTRHEKSARTCFIRVSDELDRGVDRAIRTLYEGELD